MISKKNIQSNLNDATNLLAMMLSNDCDLETIKATAIEFVIEHGYKTNAAGNYVPAEILDSEKIERSQALNDAAKLLYRAMAKTTVNSTGNDKLNSVSGYIRALFSEFESLPLSVRVDTDSLMSDLGITVS